MLWPPRPVAQQYTDSDSTGTSGPMMKMRPETMIGEGGGGEVFHGVHDVKSKNRIIMILRIILLYLVT